MASRETAFLLGAGTLVGGIVIGKVAIDLVQGAVPKGPPGEPSALEQSVRFVGSLLGISVAVLQLPAAWDAAQKLIAEGGIP